MPLKMLVAVAAIASVALGLPAAAQTSPKVLRIGLADDPDALDPTLSRTYVGRIVFTALCDKLFDTDAELNFVPQLALSYAWSEDNRALTFKLRPGVAFQDGTPFNAAAVKFNIERNLTMEGSQRRTEMGSVTGAEVVDDLTVRIDLKTPFVPLMAALSDRAMMISPTAAEAEGAGFANHPVCAGPFKFVERVQQDRIVLERFDGYWNKDKVHLDRIVFRPIPDASVRLANLQSGDLDFIERLAPTDAKAIAANPRLKLASITSIGYQGITINVAHGDRAKPPLGSDPRVREALDLAIDRKVLNDVVFEGQYQPGNEWVPPGNRFYVPVGSLDRNLARAKELLQQAGEPHPSVTLMMPTDTESLQLAQVIAQMAGEAGFDIHLEATEFATALSRANKGDFEAFLIGWSGATDVDRNLYQFVSCKSSLNDGRYCNAELDALLEQQRAEADPKRRQEILAKIAAITIGRDRPLIYLFHRKWLYGMTARLKGFTPSPDGIPRLNQTELE